VTLVADASAVVAALVDTGPAGRWAEALLASDDLAAPHLMLVEVANILRRAERAGDVSSATAALAHADLVALRVLLFPYDVVGDRVWELRSTITAYDAWYVALAEALGAPLATLDLALSRVAGPRCEFATPPSAPLGRPRQPDS
jgi:predicted nucleic acid-binding protein